MLLQEALAQLEAAEEAAITGGWAVADWELAQHRCRLGRACWALGGTQQRQRALSLWLQAAAVEGPAQVWSPSLLMKKGLRRPDHAYGSTSAPIVVACHAGTLVEQGWCTLRRRRRPLHGWGSITWSSQMGPPPRGAASRRRSPSIPASPTQVRRSSLRASFPYHRVVQ
jgi:hypothetical protein